MTVSKIDKFEKNNKDIAVNVLYTHQKEEGKSKGKIAILQGDQMGIQVGARW